MGRDQAGLLVAVAARSGVELAAQQYPGPIADAEVPQHLVEALRGDRPFAEVGHPVPAVYIDDDGARFDHQGGIESLVLGGDGMVRRPDPEHRGRPAEPPELQAEETLALGLIGGHLRRAERLVKAALQGRQRQHPRQVGMSAPGLD